MSTAKPPSRWARYFFINLLISIVLLVMSIIFLGMGISEFTAGNTSPNFTEAVATGIFELALGAVGAYVSYNMLSSTLKVRGATTSKLIEKLVTVETCPQCSYKEERPYSEGDYVRKQTSACPKCTTMKKISAIFLEKPGTPGGKAA